MLLHPSGKKEVLEMFDFQCTKRQGSTCNETRQNLEDGLRLQPNIGSDRSWVWKVAAEYSETPPTSETLAIRFANSESSILDAPKFKKEFEAAQKTNAALRGGAPAEASLMKEKKDEVEKEEKGG
ncbi:hypothetical protein C8R41DRAFT_865655 [Lentinula lateritia]|uniref:RanBD1 domain-containing protein n=1 Tax=Lentinula lateritia TaxID=40482 RepID=A0ABQ8VLR1_9AGAR|nr:hypothetical protein C8R41DRAFT_865655 [Lentinula lateritia]